jgi:chromosome segregation ATPase
MPAASKRWFRALKESQKSFRVDQKRPICANIPHRNQRSIRGTSREAVMIWYFSKSARAEYVRSAAAGLCVIVVVLSANAARGQDANSTVASPVEAFSRQLEDFQKSAPDLNKAIQESAGTIDSITDIEKARAEIDKLRETVSTLLGAVSDDSPISQLGVKAHDHIRNKLKALSQESRFKPDERQYLIDQWRKLEQQTDNATKELEDARVQFAGLLQTLQQNEDFIGELLEIRQAEKAIEVIRRLTHDIRDASTQLNKLIGGIKPPGA